MNEEMDTAIANVHSLYRDVEALAERAEQIAVACQGTLDDLEMAIENLVAIVRFEKAQA